MVKKTSEEFEEQETKIIEHLTLDPNKPGYAGAILAIVVGIISFFCLAWVFAIFFSASFLHFFQYTKNKINNVKNLKNNKLITSKFNFRSK
jgi:hypothetical protein